MTHARNQPDINVFAYYVFDVVDRDNLKAHESLALNQWNLT